MCLRLLLLIFLLSSPLGAARSRGGDGAAKRDKPEGPTAVVFLGAEASRPLPSERVASPSSADSMCAAAFPCGLQPGPG